MVKKEVLSKFLLLAIMLPVNPISPNMGIQDLFRPTVNTAKPNGSLSQVLGPVAPTPVQPPAQYNLKDRGVSVSDADLNAIRPLIYGEISNRAPDKQALETNVILNTALNRVKEYNARGQNKTLADVIAMPKQYQAYGGNQYQQYSAPPDAVAMAKKKQVDTIMDGISKQIQSGKYPDNTQGAFYYVHDPKTGKITYDNTRPLFAK